MNGCHGLDQLPVEVARALLGQLAVGDDLPAAGDPTDLAVGGDVLDGDRQHSVAADRGGEEPGVDRSLDPEPLLHRSGLEDHAAVVVESVVRQAGRFLEMNRSGCPRSTGWRTGCTGHDRQRADDRLPASALLRVSRAAGRRRASRAGQQRKVTACRSSRPIAERHPAVRALLEVGERRDLAQQLASLRPLTQRSNHRSCSSAIVPYPASRNLRTRGALEVVPRAHDHLGRDAVALQPLEQQRRTALEQVVLAADEERRHPHLVDVLDRRALAVERAVVRRVPAEEGLQPSGRVNVTAAFRCSMSIPIAVDRVARDVRRRDQAGAGDQAQPQRDEADVDLPAGGDDVAVDVGARNLREDRLQPGGCWPRP